MKYFTPIMNFNFDTRISWKNISSIKIKYITEKEALKLGWKIDK